VFLHRISSFVISSGILAVASTLPQRGAIVPLRFVSGRASLAGRIPGEVRAHAPIWYHRASNPPAAFSPTRAGSVKKIRRRKSMYRTSLRLTASLAAMLAFAVSCFAAQPSWKPLRPVAFIVGATPGGGLDLTARVLQQIWDGRKTVGVPVVVVNKPGAANAIAWTYLNDRGDDGHAIAIGSTNLITNSIIGTHALSYRDITPLAILIDDFLVFAVRADSPLKTMKEAMEKLRRDPAALSVGITPGRGSPNHTSMGLAAKAAGIDARRMRFVPYKSATEVMTALLSGEIDIASVSSSNTPTLLTAGRIRAIGVTAPKRLGGVLASAPTLPEQGINATFTNWRAVIGPKNMPRPAVAFWEAALAEAVKTSEWEREVERNFWVTNFRAGAIARKFMESDAGRFETIWKEIGAPE
jgi:putative tricarboxylic transport membrane protein